ncbi:MAG: hypothetical protein ACW7DQ_18185 [Paraglaciecola chathamensis]
MNKTVIFITTIGVKMGILSRIGSWVATNIPVVATVVKKTAEIIYKGAEYVERLLEGREILKEIGDDTVHPHQMKKGNERPNLIDDDESSDEGFLSTLSAAIDDSKNKLLRVEKENTSDHKKIQLQIDVMELIVSAQTVERFTNNINLHAANLQIHLQTIQNTAGLMDDVNRQRVAVKAIMKTVNHLINVTGKSDVVRPLEGLDVDMKPGNISIYGAYEAFENTKSLLINEIESFSNALDDQVGRIENIKASARKTPEMMKKINSWVEYSIEPSLYSAKKEIEELKGGLVVIPALEAKLKRELKSIQDTPELA